MKTKHKICEMQQKKAFEENLNIKCLYYKRTKV